MIVLRRTAAPNSRHVFCLSLMPYLARFVTVVVNDPFTVEATAAPQQDREVTIRTGHAFAAGHAR